MPVPGILATIHIVTGMIDTAKATAEAARQMNHAIAQLDRRNRK
jgi:hypothetical protein